MKPILIVGAGPVGLTAALALAYQGLESIIFEKKQHWSPCGSRAIVIDNGALREFKALGVAGDMLEQGLVALRRRTFFETKELYSTEFPQPTGTDLPLFLNLPQSQTEEVLLHHVQQSPLITLRWDEEVTGVENNPDHVVVTTSGGKCIEGAYMIAADGCRSIIRNLCKLDFPGYTNPWSFMIVDVRANLPHQREHRFYFNHPANPGGTLLLVPQPKGIWRIDWQLPPGSTRGQVFAAEEISAKVRTILGGSTAFEIIWSSCYQFHQRLMTSMRAGRIFFAGDSAHLTNPFGGRNLNAGVQDAVSAAWKIAAVLLGKANPLFVHTYEIERGLANQEHQRATRKSMKFIAPTNRWQVAFRDTVLRLSSNWTWVRRFVNSGKMSPPCDRKAYIPNGFILNNTSHQSITQPHT